MKDKIGNLIEVEWQKIEPLQPDDVKIQNNKEELKQSLLKYGFVLPFAVWVENDVVYCVDGHTRKEALNELIQEGHNIPNKLKAYEVKAKDRQEAISILVEVYNQKHNPFDKEVLTEWLEVEEVEVQSLEMVNVEEVCYNENITNEDKEVEAHMKLQDRFVVPPFSVLDTRQGYWRERKEHWKNLIQDNGESRENLLGGLKTLGQTAGVSLLDPVLSEIVNIWFGVENGNTFDCFAGDSVFGYVSSYLGNSFTGIELRKEQAKLNNERIKGFNSIYHCDDGRNVLNHIKENSQDLLFSCPPYFDLEVYSDLENDASNQESYEDFLQILDTAFSNSIKCLKDNRFAVIVVGDVRDKKGFYYRLIDDVKDVFKKNDVYLYNELILLDQLGTAPKRANKQMNNRKVVKVHQNVLVFYKGEPKNIQEHFSKIDVDYESTDV